jgi:hypothetical protein
VKKTQKQIAVVLGILIAVSPLVYAQSDQNLPTPPTMPNSAFYGLERAWESIQLAFAFNDADKANLHYKFAEYRLAEAQAMAAENKSDLAENSLQDYQNELNSTETIMEKAIARGINMTALEDRINNNNAAQTLALENITITVGNKSTTITVPIQAAERFFNRVEKFGNRTGAVIMQRVDKATEAINNAQAEIDAASNLDLTNVGKVLLANAENRLQAAKNASANGYYGNAYGQAIAARALALNSEKHVVQSIPGNETTHNETINNETENNRTVMPIY